MKMVITYQLDEAGRRASLRANGDGRVHQVLLVEATPELLGAAIAVDEDGSASYDLSSWRHEGVAGVYISNHAYSDVVRDPVAEVMREEERRSGLLAREAAAAAGQLSVLPEGFRWSGAASAVGWFDFSKVGNTLRGKLLGMFQRRAEGSRSTSATCFFQVEIAESCVVKDEDLLVTAKPGDVVNINYGSKTNQWGSLIGEMNRGAEYEVIVQVLSERTPAFGGLKLRDVTLSYKEIKPADPGARTSSGPEEAQVRELDAMVEQSKQVIGAQVANVESVIASLAKITWKRLNLLDRTRLTGAVNALHEVVGSLKQADVFRDPSSPS
jgi:hypothetical protein